MLAALPAGDATAPLPADPGSALIAVLCDLLQLPASRNSGGTPGVSDEAAEASVDAVYDGLLGEDDLHAVHLLWALQAQLRASPELTDCSDLGTYLVKKYLPAVERPLFQAKPVLLIPPKNRRFLEFARVIGLARPELLAEFDPDADWAAGEGGGWGDGDDDGSDYDSDDNSTAAQMHRHFSKMEMFGIPIPGARDMLDEFD